MQRMATTGNTSSPATGTAVPTHVFCSQVLSKAQGPPHSQKRRMCELSTTLFGYYNALASPHPRACCGGCGDPPVPRRGEGCPNGTGGNPLQVTGPTAEDT
eukprot:4138994-Alexandrium_andersonii.AAC.1